MLTAIWGHLSPIKGYKMIKLLFIFLTLFTSNVFANNDYSSDIANDIQSIYWLNKNTDGAIVYAKHHGFVQLRTFIDTALLTSNQVIPKPLENTGSKFNHKKAEQLLLMLPAAKKWLVVYFTKDQISFDGQTYSVDPHLMKEMTTMNHYRINKGDLISSQLLDIAKKSFGLS